MLANAARSGAVTAGRRKVVINWLTDSFCLGLPISSESLCTWHRLYFHIWPVSFCIFNSQSTGLWAISMFACDLICNYVTVRLCFVFWPSYLSECFLVGVCVLSVPHLSLCVALPQPVFDSCCRFLLSFHSVSSFLPLYEFLGSRDWIWQWSFRVLWMQKLLII